MGVGESLNRAEGDIDRAVLARFFAQPQARQRIFVDVGAARPDYLSISARFREQGWRVICIEPNPDFAALHAKAGHEVYQYACAAEDRDGVEFSVVNSHNAPYEGGAVSYESFSALSIKPAYLALKPDLDTRKISVNVRRLDTILGEHAPDVSVIDVLSADVEGWELEVLEGLDVARYQPKVMILENFLRDRAYVRRLRDLGYVLWRRSFPNDVYVLPELLKGTLERFMAGLNGWRFG
jgi:FkbM family methyltransferase